MVHYLGIDFLQDALDQRRKFLNQALLVIPHHLEHVDSYIHHGKLNDPKYRVPWKRATSELNFLQHESELPGKEFLEASVHSRHYVEPYDNMDVEEHGNFDLYEFVPSSNPGSPDVFDDCDFILKSRRVSDKYNNVESLVKEDLKSWCITADCENLLLEELFSQDNLKETTKKIPRSYSLIDRLQTKQIKDPFADTYKDDFKWKNLKCLEKYDKDKQKQVTEIEHGRYRDIPDKIDFSSSEYGILEESLSPLVTIKREESLSESCIKNIVDKQSQDELMKIENKSDREPDFDEIVLVSDRKKSREALEKAAFSPCESHQTTFLEINLIDQDDDEDMFVSKAFLDSPVEDVILNEEKEDLTNIKLNLNPFVIPYETTRLLTVSCKEKLENKLRNREKLFDDVLVLQLVEPDTDHKLCSRISISEARVLLSLSEEEEIGKLELKMTWDALSFSKSKMLQHRYIECLKLTLDDVSLDTIITENFEKFSDADLYEWQDLTLDGCISSNLDTKESQHTIESGPHFKYRNDFPSKIPNTDELYSGRSESTSTSSCKKQIDSNMMNDKGAINFDPLESFLCIRSKKIQDCKLEYVKDSSSIESVRKNVHQILPERKGKMKSKCKTINFQLKGEFQEVIKTIDNSAKYCLVTLRETGDILPTHDFKSLTPDVTRFLLKQREKYLQDSREDGTRDSCYKAVIAVHALCSTKELLVECCLESAIAYLTSIQEKYQEYIKESLEKIRKQLFQYKCNFHQNKIFHPKLFVLCQKIEERLKKKVNVSPDSEQKVLVIVKRDLPSLTECIKEALCNGGVVRAEIHTNNDHEDIVKKLDEYNCLIMLKSDIQDDFPWAQFSLVIEYEKDEDEKFRSLCQRQNIRYLTFTLSDVSVQDPPATVGIDMKKTWYTQLTVIGSVNLTTQPDLLQMLETRYNLLILERDFNLIKAVEKKVFADLIIDERTCIVFHPILDLSEEFHLEPFTSKIISLSIKYTTCWVILCNNGKKSYQYSNCVISNMYKLHATFANFVHKQEDFIVKVITSVNTEETAAIVRRICDLSVEKSSVWKQKDWENRHWLSEEMLQEERILLTIPCLNSFSAQLMLQQSSLKILLGLSYTELSNMFPWIPVKVLKIFIKQVGNNTGLQLRQSTSLDSINTAVSEKSSASSIVKVDTEPLITSGEESDYLDDTYLVSANPDDRKYVDCSSFSNVPVIKNGNNFMTYDRNVYSMERVPKRQVLNEDICPTYVTDLLDTCHGKTGSDSVQTVTAVTGNLDVLEPVKEIKHQFKEYCSGSHSENENYGCENTKPQFYKFSPQPFQQQESNASSSFSGSQNVYCPNEYVRAEIEGRLQSFKSRPKLLQDMLCENNADFSFFPQYHLAHHHQPLSTSFVEPYRQKSELFDSVQTGQHLIPCNYSVDRLQRNYPDFGIRNLQPKSVPFLDNEQKQEQRDKVGFPSNHYIHCSTGLDSYFPQNGNISESSRFLQVPLGYCNENVNKIPKPGLGYKVNPNRSVERLMNNESINNNFRPLTSLDIDSSQPHSLSTQQENNYFPSYVPHYQRNSFHHQSQNRPYENGNSQHSQNCQKTEEIFNAPNSSQQSRNFIADLSRTTRNLLRHAYSGQMSQPRLPGHRISIGLAQPQPRKSAQTALKKEESSQTSLSVTASCSDQHTVPHSSVTTSRNDLSSNSVIPQQVTYKQSQIKENTQKTSNGLRDGHTEGLWLSYDSPPMDLEPETPLFDNLLETQDSTRCNSDLIFTRKSEPSINKIGLTNRRVFQTDCSTPNKRRKLTYHKTPGCKSGQTKLIFQ